MTSKSNTHGCREGTLRGRCCILPQRRPCSHSPTAYHQPVCGKHLPVIFTEDVKFPCELCSFSPPKRFSLYEVYPFMSLSTSFIAFIVALLTSVDSLRPRTERTLLLFFNFYFRCPLTPVLKHKTSQLLRETAVHAHSYLAIYIICYLPRAFHPHLSSQQQMSATHATQSRYRATKDGRQRVNKLGGRINNCGLSAA